jgi:hypothetical protein
VKRQVVLVVLAGVFSTALLPVSAAPVGAPRMALSPTISIPLPAKGKAGFALVTVTGALKLGVSDPGLTLALAVDPRKLPVTVHAADGQTKPTTSHGTTTAQFYVWIVNIGARAPKQTLDVVVVGAHSVWGGSPLVHEKSVDCRALKGLRYRASSSLVRASNPQATLANALRAGGC